MCRCLDAGVLPRLLRSQRNMQLRMYRTQTLRTKGGSQRDIQPTQGSKHNVAMASRWRLMWSQGLFEAAYSPLPFFSSSSSSHGVPPLPNPSRTPKTLHGRGAFREEHTSCLSGHRVCPGRRNVRGRTRRRSLLADPLGLPSCGATGKLTAAQPEGFG